LGDIIAGDQFDDILESDEFKNLEGQVPGDISTLFLNANNIFENDSGSIFAQVNADFVGTPIFGLGSGQSEDTDLFSINPSTGELELASFPGKPLVFDFESPADVSANNIYNITLSVTDGIDAPIFQNVTLTVENINALSADNFVNNLGQNPSAFDAFGSQAAFIAAMQDGTLTWSSNSLSANFSNGGLGVGIDTVDLVIKTLSKTVEFGITGVFSGADIGGGRFASGNITVNLGPRNLSEFGTQVPGQFLFSNVANGGGAGQLVPVAGEIFGVTATVTAGDRSMSSAIASGLNDDISTIVTVNTGAIIGEKAALQFEAAAVIDIIDAGNLTTGGRVGIGQPTIVE